MSPLSRPSAAMAGAKAAMEAAKPDINCGETRMGEMPWRRHQITEIAAYALNSVVTAIGLLLRGSVEDS